MSGSGSSEDTEAELVSQVIAACQAGIARALAEPSEALSLARGLDAALTSLKLVEAEVGKGEHGARAIVDNAEALTRQALTDVLRIAPDPARSLDALAAVARVGPHATGAATETSAALMLRSSIRAGVEPRSSRLPSFGQVSQAYIDMRIGTDGEDHKDIRYLHLRRQTFIDLIGDRPVDQYYPSDLQDYVSQMQFWPANVTKRLNAAGKTTREILEANKNLSQKPLSRKTLQDGYVANIRTMMRHGMAEHMYRDPFAGAKLRWPKTLAGSTPREGIDLAVLNRVFRQGTASGLLDEAMLPLLSALTSRRLGLLLYLRGSDIRDKHGVAIAQTSGIVLENGCWRRVPIKTDESRTFFVLHDFLSEIGFVDWARRQEGWVFAEPHLHPDPSRYTSKAMNRLLRRCGAAGGNAEVFHSLRGDAITLMRRGEIQSRAARLQAGHELSEVHELYGFRALDAEDCRRLARLPLSDDIDWGVFHGLEFETLAAGRRSRGRPRKGRS